MAGLTDSSEDAVHATAQPYRWAVLGGLWLIYVTFGLLVVSLAPLAAPIMRDLDTSHGNFGLVFGAWQLMFVLAAVPCGMLLDRIGPRIGLMIGTLFLVASGLMRSMATDVVTLWLAVAMFGIGGPLISTGAPKLVSRWFTGPERGFAMGIYITGPSVGAILGLSTTNAILLPYFEGDWRSILRLWAGLALLAGLIWVLIAQAPVMKQSDRAEAKKARLPQWQVLKELMAIPAVRIVLAMSIGAFMFNHSLNNWLPELLRSRGMSATVAGYWATVPTIIGILGALTLPRLATPERRYLLLVGICVCAVLASLLLRAEVGMVLFSGLILQGAARSALATIMILTLVETRGVGEERAGVAAGLFFSAAELGGAGGPVLLGVVYDLSGGFDAGLACLSAIAMALVLSATWLLMEARTSQKA